MSSADKAPHYDDYPVLNDLELQRLPFPHRRSCSFAGLCSRQSLNSCLRPARSLQQFPFYAMGAVVK